jgi:peptidoglycan/xylan/chitin deacetylase (PgdA/CDA1 family)
MATTLTTPIGAALVAAGAASDPYRAPDPVAAGDAPVDCGLFPCVALTYDDGPSVLTSGILDALATRHAAVTFFVLGQSVGGRADVVRRAVAEGHEVQNHSWNHPRLPTLTPAAVTRQIRDTSGAIEAVTGEKVTMFRPPYGDYNPAVLEAAGLPAILWDVDTLDWQGPSDEQLVRRAVDQPRPGSIVLQHDIHANSARTVGAVADGLRDRGFTLVTVTQLFGGQTPTAGAWRSAR